MKIKLKIQQKIQFFILGSFAIIFAIAIGYIGRQAKKKVQQNLYTLTECLAEQKAAFVEKNLEADIVIARTLAKVVEKYLDMSFEERKKIIAEGFFNVLSENSHIDAIWDEWDMKYLDHSMPDSILRYSYICYWGNNIIEEGIAFFDYYHSTFITKRELGIECVGDPYLYSYGGKDSVIVADLNAPIFNKDDVHVGNVSIDYKLTRFQEIVSKIRVFKGNFSYLVTNTGFCIGHSNSDFLGQRINEIYPEQSKTHDLLKKIKEGKADHFISRLEDGNLYYFIFKPVQVGRSNAPWSLAIAVPVNEIQSIANRTLNRAIMVGLMGLLVLSIVIGILSKNITNPLKKITKSLKGLAEGEIKSSMKSILDTGDEIGEIGEMAEAFNVSIEGLKKKAKFAELIGMGNLETDIEILGDNDILGKSLVEMRNSLREAKKDEEKRNIEDKQRRWINEGLAIFSDVLRQNNDNLEKLSYEVIKNLVKYLNANQGGLFITDETNQFLDMEAAFAYDQKRFFEKKIKLGEGFVGRCAIEKMKIYMTSIPEDYLEIASGLGSSFPECLLLIPLMLEGKVLGVIELASLDKFQEYEIEFIEKVAENVASTISSVGINSKTSELLAQSKQQAEELISQEEEMRQNMEELQATQEEASRKKIEMEGLLDALNASSFLIEYDMNKKVTKINDAYLEIHGMKRDEVVGLYHYDNMEFTDEQWKNYEQFWNDLKRGEVKRQRSVFTMKGKKYDLMEVFTPIKDESGKVYKILKIANDMGKYK